MHAFFWLSWHSGFPRLWKNLENPRKVMVLTVLESCISFLIFQKSHGNSKKSRRIYRRKYQVPLVSLISSQTPRPSAYAFLDRYGHMRTMRWKWWVLVFLTNKPADSAVHLTSCIFTLNEGKETESKGKYKTLSWKVTDTVCVVGFAWETCSWHLLYSESIAGVSV